MNIEAATRAARHEVHTQAIWLFEMGLVAESSGNISMRIPDTDLIAVTPSGVRYADLVPSDIVVTDHSGTRVLGHREPTSETVMHRAVYATRPETAAIAHTHSPYATAFAVIHEPIPLVTNEGLGVRSTRIDVARFGVPGSLEIAEAVVEVLENNSDTQAVLLANHGLLTLGDDLASACRLAHEVELEARVYYLARTIGNVHTLSQAQLDTITESYGKRASAGDTAAR